MNTAANMGIESGPAMPVDSAMTESARQASSSSVFLQGCRELLLDPRRSAEQRSLIRFLHDSGSLMPLILDTADAAIQEASAIARLATEEYGDFPEKLLGSVREARAELPGSVDRALQALRVLETIWSREQFVIRLLEIQSAESRLRSKITLIVGRLTQSPKWLMERLKDQDPRVRANAVEGLWASNLEGLESVFLEAARDPHHRIAANAALGLYALGDPSAVHILYSMLRNGAEMFRRAALWGVGRVADSRYELAVASIAQDGTGEEQKIAERVLGRISASRAIARFRSALSLEIVSVARSREGVASASVRCLLHAAQRWLVPPDVNALNFVIIDGDKQIEEYTLSPVEPAGPLSVVIVTPAVAGAAGGFLEAAWRETQGVERVAIIGYQQDAPRPGSETKDTAVRFDTAIRPLIEAALANYPEMRSLDSAIEAGVRALRTESGKKVLFAIVQPGASQPVSFSLTTAAIQSGIAVHAIVSNEVCSEVTDSLRILAASSRGRFTGAKTLEELVREIVSVRAEHHGEIKLSWRSAKPASSEVRITCSCSYGFGDGVFVGN